MSAAALALLLAAAARPAAAAARLSPVAEAQLDEGLRRLYALDYARSRAAFHRLAELEPDNPAGYLFEAGGIWWQFTQENGLYRDSPALQRLFERDVAETVRAAAPGLRSDDPRARAQAHFMSGMALGALGQWRLIQHRWLDAYFAGKKAVRHLRACQKNDPDYSDALLGLGLFDYQTARLSGVAKLGFLLGLRGDENRGIERIRLAMERSRYSGRQAAQLLAQIHIADRRDAAGALPIVLRLRAAFPDSPYFLFLEIVLRHRLDDDAASLARAEELYARIQADPAAFRHKWLSLACGLSAENCLSPADARSAVSWLDRALAGGVAAGESATLLHVSRGLLLDVLERRDEAVADYQRALALPDFDVAHALAAACSSAPCGRAELLARLRAMARAGEPDAPDGNGIVTQKR